MKELYYYVLRRFPPKNNLPPDKYEAYCRWILTNKECYNRVIKDYYSDDKPDPSFDRAGDTQE